MTDMVHAETIEESLTSKYIEIWKKKEDIERALKLKGIEEAAESLPIALGGETVKEMAVRRYLEEVIEENDQWISKKRYGKIEEAVEYGKFVKAQNLLEEEDKVEFERWRV